MRTEFQKTRNRKVDAKVSEVVILRKAKRFWNRHPERLGRYTLN